MIKFHIYFFYKFNALKFCNCFESYMFCGKLVPKFLLILKKSLIKYIRVCKSNFENSNFFFIKDKLNVKY